MRIYFSGGRGLKCTPETLIASRKPCIMLTFQAMDVNGSIDRFNVFAKATNYPLLKRTGMVPVMPDDGVPHHCESMFMDSGAYTLYNQMVRRRNGSHAFETGGGIYCYKCEKLRSHPNHLNPPPPHVRGGMDTSYYDLRKGKPFRKYCDAYAKFLHKYEGSGMLYTNVDVITYPEKTWEVQRFFEEEHALYPIPVVHAGTPLPWLWKYIDTGKYQIIGLGGLGQNIGIDEYHHWATGVYRSICPKSNDFKPIVRTHGFAMTSWKLIRAYPWSSVDSATWIKLAAYGWLYVPRWTSGGWDFGIPPLQINVSIDSPQNQKGRHLQSGNVVGNEKVQDSVRRWLDFCEVELGSAKKMSRRLQKRELADYGAEHAPEDHKEATVAGHFVYRALANLLYLKMFEEGRPKWPHPYYAPEDYGTQRLLDDNMKPIV